MKVSDIKVGYIYNVIFDPVRDCEFDGKHLAVVLKRNNDNKTFIVMPLTSASNGNGVNKLKIRGIANLPTSIKRNESYAVLNQIRTVNADRFIALKEGQDRIDVPLERDILLELLALTMQEIIFSVEQDEKITILKYAYDNLRFNKAKNLAYDIIKLQKTIKDAHEKIMCIKSEIKETLKDVVYVLEPQQIEDGIQEIFTEALRQ